MSRQKFVGKGDLAMRPESVGLTWPRAPVHADDNEWLEPNVKNGVAVVRICGPLEHRGSGYWFDSYEKILGRVEGALEDEKVHAVLLDIDSPGGEVSGLQETVRKIRSMRQEYGKPIVAYADDEAYSAAYALACSADEIYLPEGGGVGSVGVLTELCDRTAMTGKAGLRIEVIRSGSLKADGHPDIPMSDGTIARVQARVDDLAEQFFQLVSEARPMTVEKLASLQGATVFGKAAVKLGLANGIASFDDVLESLSKSSARIDSKFRGAIPSVPGEESDMTINAKAVAILAALRSANTASKKKKAIAAYDALLALVGTKAVSLKKDATKKKLAAAYASALASLTEAKVKRMYKKKEETIEEDDGEAEAEEDEESEGDDDDDGDDDEDDDDDEEEAEEEDAEDAKKAKGKTAKSLAAFVKSLTGQSSSVAAQQVLASMHEQAQQNAENTAKIARLEADAVDARRKSLISSMVSAGQLKPAQLAWAETQPIASLKSYAKHTPAMFAPRARPVNESVGHGSGEASGPDGLTDFERKLCAEQGLKPEAYVAARDGGATILPKVN